jgi:hypothetical protein
MLNSLLLVSALFLGSKTTFADAMSDWTIISSDSAQGRTPDKIKSILLTDRYKLNWLLKDFASTQIVGGFTPPIVFLSVSVTTFKFTGSTTCPVNDPRLIVTAVSGVVEYPESRSMAWSPTMPGGDPCSDSYKAPSLSLTKKTL